jgi:hypothetical protein
MNGLGQCQATYYWQYRMVQAEMKHRAYEKIALSLSHLVQ